MTHKNDIMSTKKKLQNIFMTSILIITLLSPLITLINADQSPPSDFHADPLSRLVIALSWTNNKDNTTYIEWNTLKTWNLGESTLLYNGTDITYTHTALSAGTKYFYQAWSYNKTNNLYSSTYQETNATTYTNQLPTQISEYPLNIQRNVSITQSTVSVIIADSEGDSFNWTIQGKYVKNKFFNNDSNGTKSTSLLIPLPYNTIITWYVNATDGFGWTNKTYHFTTRAEYVPKPPSLFTANSMNRTKIHLAWTHGAYSNKVYIRYSSSGYPADRNSGNYLCNSTDTSYIVSNLIAGTTYYFRAWSWNNTDSCWNQSYKNATATTASNHAPSVGTPSPTNGSTNQQLSVIWQVAISDSDSDAFNWFITCSNGQSNSSSASKNGTKTLSINALSFNTQYTVWVNATDRYDWSKAIYTFKTGDIPPGGNNGSPPQGSDTKPPTKPENVACKTPENDNTPRFTWSASTDESGIKAYYIKINNGIDIPVGNTNSWTATIAIKDGSHTFSVKAQDMYFNNGSYGSCTFTIKTTTSGTRPFANAGGLYYGLTYKPIQFDGSRSYDLDGKIDYGIWDFGDGTNATGTKPTHTFTEAGLFNVTLTVTDNDGLTSKDITTVTVLLDTDRDDYSDDMELSYGSDPNDPDSYPLDTDRDGIPDDPTPDRKYIGDFDDDGDGLRDDYEKTLGSNSKDNTDVIVIKINTSSYFLVDINADGIMDIFYNEVDQTNTALAYRVNEYFIDINNDGKWDKTYNTLSEEVTSYSESQSKAQSTWDPWILIVFIAIVIITSISLIVKYVLKIGYIYIEHIPEDHKKKKKH